MGHPCDAVWALADWLTVEQAAAMWCGGDTVCEVARIAAISSAVERGEIEERKAASSPGFSYGVPEGLAKGWIEVNRVALSIWAESLPPEVQPNPGAMTTRVRMDDSHLRALDALAHLIGIDFAQHGSAAKLREKTELHGLGITPDAAERIAKKIRDKRGEWGG